MIKTSIGIPLDYGTLEEILATKLNQNTTLVSPLKVSCSKESHKLIITVQHPESAISHPRKLFRTIHDTIQEKNIVEDIAIYLVVSGNNQWEFCTQMSISAPKNSLLALPYSQDTHQQQSDSFPFKFLDQRKPTKPIIIWGTIIITILGFLVLGYLFSRPCVINECLLIPETKEFVEKSLSTLKEKDHKNVPLENVINDLNQAVNNLQTIPFWSKFYDQAQEFINQYQLKIQQFNQAIKAIELANQAQKIRQKSSLSIKKWQESLTLWQQALNILEQLKIENNNLFIINKKKEYQENISSIKAKIKEEKEHKEYLLSAQQAAKLAQSRQQNAQSLINLQLVEATWKTAIKRLENIAPQSYFNPEKQELLSNYLPQFLAAKKRRQQEESAISLYNQALEQAKLAAQHKINNQLSSSVTAWKNAIELLKKLPSETFQSRQANQLVNNYEKQLSKTEAWLQAKLVIEQAKNDLGTTCFDSPKICNFSVNNNVIKVFLTNQYITIINDINKTSNASSLDAKEKIKSHIIQVENNFKYISLKYDLPVEIYHPNGDLMIKYEIE